MRTIWESGLLRGSRKLLLGYYGAGNFGDEAILKEYLIRNPGESFIIFSYGHLYAGKNVYQTYKWEYNRRIANVFNFLSALIEVDEVRWVGGTCFTDEDGDGAFKYMLLAKLFLRKIKYVNIGINKLHRTSKIVRTRVILSIADYISLRDNQSYRLAASYILPLSRTTAIDRNVERDLGECYLEKFQSIATDEKNLCIAWRTLEKYQWDETKLVKSLVAYIEDLSENFSNVYIIDADPLRDAETSRSIFESLSHLKNVVYLDRLSLDERIRLISKCCRIITARLHIAIFAKILKKRVDVFAYSDKIKYYTENNSSVRPFTDFAEL